MSSHAAQVHRLFTMLCATRVEANPIQFVEIDALMRIEGIRDTEARSLIAEAIVATDVEWLKHARKRSSTKGKD